MMGECSVRRCKVLLVCLLLVSGHIWMRHSRDSAAVSGPCSAAVGQEPRAHLRAAVEQDIFQPGRSSSAWGQ